MDPRPPHLSDTLHGTANFMGHALKAVQIPAGDFGDDVVQTGLKAGGGFLRYSVLDVGQVDAQSQLSSNKSQGIPVEVERHRNQLEVKVSVSKVSYCLHQIYDIVLTPISF